MLSWPGIFPMCLKQIKVVWMILEKWDVIVLVFNSIRSCRMAVILILRVNASVWQGQALVPEPNKTQPPHWLLPATVTKYKKLRFKIIWHVRIRLNQHNRVSVYFIVLSFSILWQQMGRSLWYTLQNEPLFIQNGQELTELWAKQLSFFVLLINQSILNHFWMNKGLFWSLWVGESLPVPILMSTCTCNPYGLWIPVLLPNWILANVSCSVPVGCPWSIFRWKELVECLSQVDIYICREYPLDFVLGA